uniref:F-box protein n=1 Tax=Lilium davidii var. unicolor TaxID=1473204 RepID=A0A0S2I766_LILDA|nr:F-box protein [Lilium davidii var. unicolor]
MGEICEFRPWDELIPELLGQIIGRLSLQEKLTIAPLVCKEWAKTVVGPYSWWEIDISDWSLWRKPEKMDRMVRMLIDRSWGSFNRLAVSGLASEEIFAYIANHAGSLQTLELPRCEISDSIVEQVASRLSTVTFLDVSYCQKLGAPGLAIIGKNCKSLVGLKRAMHPLEVVEKFCQDDEAGAIATTMPKLRHLEVAYSLLTTGGVIEILSGCKDLEFLDLRGCWDVQLNQKYLKEKRPDLKVLGPEINDSYARDLWDDCSDDDSMDSWEDAGYWDDEQDLEGLEVRFYNGDSNYAIADFGWTV